MRYCLLLTGLTLACGACLAQDAAELEGDHNVRAELATPHTDWAVPYALGRTRVLFFLRGHGTEPREVIELVQRFDLDPQMVFWARVIDSTHEDWHGAERGVQRMARLLSQKWDAFVFLSPGGSDVGPDMLPAEQQYVMFQAVTQGAGLVLVGAEDKRVLKEKNRLKPLPAALGDVDGAAAFTVKQGRGVRLPKRPMIDFRPGWEVAYDQWAMRVGKAILWAAGKEPRLGLTLRPKSRELARAGLPGPAAALAWQGAAPGTVAEVRVRRDDGAPIVTTRQPLDKPDGAVDLRMPLVRAGKYHIDVVARAGDRVAGFTSASLAVVCPQQVAEIALDATWAEVGQKLSGKVRLAGAMRAGQRVIVSLIDPRDRQIARQILPATGAALPFVFQVEPWFPMLLEVRATLTEPSGEVASAWRFAQVVKRHRGQFNFVMWDTPRGALAPWAEQALAGTGVTMHLGNGTPQTYLAASEMAWIPYTTHVAATRDERGVMKPVCWADETRIQAHVDAIVDKHVASRRHGVFVYSLGDEIAVRGSCLSPHCLTAYRKYLREQYADIAALNASWGTRYTSFDAVQLGKPDDNDEAESLRAGNFPRWFDRQAYQSDNFCKLCERFGKGFRRIDPEGRCGFEGAGTFGAADDLDGFVRRNAFWSPYPGTADEVVRSIAPRDFPRSNWMGYTKDADSLLEKYWRMLTRGCDAVWWWRWDAMGRFHGWLSPTLDPYPAVKDILRDTQIVRQGLGDLLLGSAMQTDGVGILFSQASAYAAKVQVSSSYGSYEGNHAAFHSALRDLGLNFLYFTDRQMRLGEVDLGQFKVILLPMTQALGPREVEMLRQYVRRGGLLVADVRPAIYDGHVKPLATGQLDDVFGVRRTGVGGAVTGSGSIRVPAAGEEQKGTAPDQPSVGARRNGPEGASHKRGLSPFASLDLPMVHADAGVLATNATAAGSARNAPLVLCNRFEKGQTVLLNLAMASFPGLNADGTPEAAARLLRWVLAKGAVAAPLSLTGADGQRLRNVELTRWTNGPVEIVSVFRHHGLPGPARLILPRPQYVYDLKARRNLGRQPAVSLTVTPFRAQFFALSPQPLAGVTLEAPPSVASGRVERVTLRSAMTEGRQAVRLQVKLPDGSPADWADTVVVAGQQGVAVDVPVAYNDPQGTWTVEATELYTGKTAAAKFTVKAVEGGSR